MQPIAAVPSHPEASNACAEDLAPLKAIARALARQAAPQLWAGAMANGGVEPSAATAVPTKPARQRRTRRHGGR